MTDTVFEFCRTLNRLGLIGIDWDFVEELEGYWMDVLKDDYK
jgi:hypothetical protein